MSGLVAILGIVSGSVYYFEYYVPVPDGAIRVPGASSITVDTADHKIFATSANAVQVIDAKTFKITDTIPLDPVPPTTNGSGGAIKTAVDTQSERLIVTHRYSPVVSIVDLASRHEVGTVTIDTGPSVWPGPATIDPQTHRAWVPYEYADQSHNNMRVAVVDLTAGSLITTFPTNQDAVLSVPPLAIDPQLRQAYLISWSTGLSLIDVDTMTPISPLPVCEGGSDLALDPVGHTAYANCYTGGRTDHSVAVVDVRNKSVARTILQGALDSPSLAFHGNTLFGTDHGLVWAADVSAATPTIRQIRTGDQPIAVDYDETSQTLYVLDEKAWLLPLREPM